MALDEITELAKTKPIDAGTKLVIGLMTGDPAIYKQGYSFGAALISASDLLSLDVRHLCVIAERVANTITKHASLTNHPLVIAECEDGLTREHITFPGLGTPEFINLDFDREGGDAEDLRDFIDQLDETASVIEQRDPDHAKAVEYREQAALYRRHS